MNNEELIQFIEHKLSADREKEVYAWLKDDENRRHFFRLEKFWSMQRTSDFSNADFLQNSYLRLQQKIQQRRKSKLLRLQNVLQWAAIVVLVSLLGLGLMRKNSSSESHMSVIVPVGERTHLILSDGTSVWLNSGTKFYYPSDFSAKKRNVILEGEAFFDVVKNQRSPFVVKSKNLKIEVLGTKFNVRSYDDEMAQISLQEGCVEVTEPIDGKQLRMHTGDLLCYSKKSGMQLKHNKSDISDYEWITGEVSIDNLSLIEITEKLHELYDVEFVISDMNLENELFTCHFRQGLPLKNVLELLRQTRKINYKIENDKIYIFNNQ